MKNDDVKKECGTGEDRHLYTVAETGRRCGVSRKTLFYYDHIGLLRPTLRSGPQQEKMYDEAALEKLMRIHEMQEAGLKLTEIRAVLNHSVDLLPSLLLARDRLEKEEKEARKKLTILQALIRQYGC